MTADSNLMKQVKSEAKQMKTSSGLTDLSDLQVSDTSRLHSASEVKQSESNQQVPEPRRLAALAARPLSIRSAQRFPLRSPSSVQSSSRPVMSAASMKKTAVFDGFEQSRSEKSLRMANFELGKSRLERSSS